MPKIVTKDDTHLDSNNDYRIKYEGCYGLFQNRVVVISSMGELEHDEVCLFDLLSGIEKYENFNVCDDIEWLIPDLGAVNVNDGVVFTMRNHKQTSPDKYRRGFTKSILRAFNPSKNEFHILDRAGYSKDDVIASLFNPLLMGSDEALDAVLSLDRLAAAFSSNYYFTLSSSINSFLLWRGANIIGIYNKSIKLFELSTPLFNDDLDALNVKWNIK